MYCGNCGKQIADGSKFCPNCGSEVGGKTAASRQQQTPNPQPQIIVVEDNDADAVTPLQQTVGTIVLVIGIVSLIFLFFNLITAFVMALVGDLLGIFVGKGTVGKIGTGICGFVIGACIVIWIIVAIGVASCLGAFN